MPSSLRYFCCACGKKDSKADYTFYQNVPKRKKNKSKLSSGSSTFTRKSLLDNEQLEHQSNGIYSRQMVFHTQSKNLSREASFESHAYHDSAAKLINGKNKMKRRKVQEIFPSDLVESNVSRTTFPWMDENFSPNISPGSNIRLGVSSVQMHAKRSLSNGSDSLQSEVNVTNNSETLNHTDDDKMKEANKRKFGFKFSLRSRSEEHENTGDKNSENGKNASRSQSMKEEMKDKLKYKASKSDIGVRQIKRTVSGSKEDRKIPRLDDLKCLPATDVSHLAKPQRRPQTSVQNVFNNTDSETNNPAGKSDKSINRLVSVQTKHSGIGGRAHKSNQPLTVVPKPVTKDYAKTQNSQQPKFANNHIPGMHESMYGYIPKIVQTVQASNALEGSKIDDFFMQCLNDNELNSFASAQEIKTPRSENQPNSTVWRSSSVPVHDGDHSVVKQTMSENGIDARNEYEIQQVTLEFGSQDSLDTDSVFINSLKKEMFENTDMAKVRKLNIENGQERFETHQPKIEDHNEIPFIDQEPDLIQGLKNVNVAERDKQANKPNNDSKYPLSGTEKDIPWEQTFSSQAEYIQSIPLKIPCHSTPPLSRKGEGLTGLNRKSNKSKEPNQFWMDNLDSEVLY